MQADYVTTTIRDSSSMRTKEQRAKLLVKAQILDANGYYVERFFSLRTIKKDKARHQDK